MELGIIDDLFPSLKTGFRVAEFNWYLQNIPGTTIYSKAELYNDYISEYDKSYPGNTDRIKSIRELKNKGFLEELSKKDIVYTVFLGNAYKYLEYIEYLKKPFVFTLYPGGKFSMYDKVSDDKLRKVFASKYFYKVIVTQKIIYDYLIENGFTKKDKIEFIYGVTTSNNPYKVDKKLYNIDKTSFDVCFVAHKYKGDLRGKGYDTFIEVCHKLHEKYKDIKFHVIGGYEADDIDISKLGDSIKLYGEKNQDFFENFYQSMDIMIAPIRKFDGFPTACCVDAALNGVAVFTADKHKLNVVADSDNKIPIFEDGSNICIINDNIEEIANKVIYYREHIDKLYELSINTKQKFEQIFSIKNQMEPRERILQEALNNHSEINGSN